MTHLARIQGMSDLTGERAAALDALRALALRIFSQFGYTVFEPPILEPAALFLERSGEDLRRGMYVFDDPAGAEVCLRPELTIPACRHFLQHYAGRAPYGRLAYVGPVFRYEAPGAGRRQYHQAGVEFIGAADPIAADAETAAVTYTLLRQAGLRGVRMRCGDLELIRAYIAGLPLAAPVRERLQRHVWRLTTFRTLLAGRGDTAADVLPAPGGADETEFLDALRLLGPGKSRAVIDAVLDLASVRHVGARGRDDIAARLVARLELASAGTVPGEILDGLEALLAIHGPAGETLTRTLAHAQETGCLAHVEPRAAHLQRRLEVCAAHGIPAEIMDIHWGFRRALRYYTSFIFDFDVPGLRGAGLVGGGGRYDHLVRDMGAAGAYPGVGSATHVEALLDALDLQGRPSAPGGPAPRALVVAQDAAAAAEVSRLARDSGWPVRVEVPPASVDSAVAAAAAEGVPFVLWARLAGQGAAVGVLDVRAGTAAAVRLEDLAGYLRQQAHAEAP